jgi:hypothetical protein
MNCSSYECYNINGETEDLEKDVLCNASLQKIKAVVIYIAPVIFARCHCTEKKETLSIFIKS